MARSIFASLCLVLLFVTVSLTQSTDDSASKKAGCGEGTGYACPGEDGCPLAMARCKVKESLELAGSGAGHAFSTIGATSGGNTADSDPGAAAASSGDQTTGGVGSADGGAQLDELAPTTTKVASTDNTAASGLPRARGQLRKVLPSDAGMLMRMEEDDVPRSECPDRKDCGPGSLHLCGGYNGCPGIYMRCRLADGKTHPSYCYKNTPKENSRCLVEIDNMKTNEEAGMSHQQWSQQHRVPMGEHKTIYEDQDMYTSGKRCGHVCQHGGTMTMNFNVKEPCTCRCKAPYTGEACDVCGIKCDHGKPSTAAVCGCICDSGFTGPTCSEAGCDLKCQNGGILDLETCKCNCINGWRGRECRRKGWCYNDRDCGSPRWGMLDSAYAKCNMGDMQSPIEIVSTNVVKDLYMSLLDVGYRGDLGGELSLANFRLKVTVDDPANNFVKFNHAKYNLHEVTFHWPGEHIVNGHRADMEIQMHHKASRGRKLSIALPIHLQDTENTVFSQLVEAMPAANSTGAVEYKVHKSISFPILKLLRISEEQRATTNFYMYEGSMTTPPCHEHVKWLVLKNQDLAGMSQEQFTRITNVLFFHNARPKKPLKKRKVHTHAYGDDQLTKNEWTYDTRPAKHVPFTDPMCKMGRHQTPIDITDYSAIAAKFNKDDEGNVRPPVSLVATEGSAHQASPNGGIKGGDSGAGDTMANFDNAPVLHHPGLMALITMYNSVPRMNLDQDEHKVFVNVPPGNTLQLQNSLFELKSLQVHSPGLHAVNGEAAAVEVVYVHENLAGDKVMLSTRFQVGSDSAGPGGAPVSASGGADAADAEAAARAASGGVAAVVDRDTGENEQKSDWLQALLDGNVPVNPVQGLPNDPNYYMYDGSLCIAPGPCQEGVRWLVMKEVMVASSKQVEEIFAKMPSGHTSRRTQKTYRRLLVSTAFPADSPSTVTPRPKYIRSAIPVR